jgi:CRP-like cAMP-binding protein
MAIKGAGSRLAHQLMYFAKNFSEQEKEVITIKIPLTHQTLAYCLNMARETVSNEMTRLARKGLITNEKNIKILDLNKLQREV